MLLGEVTRIYAREVHSSMFRSPLEATVVALVSFDRGATITMTISAELHGYKRFADLVLFGSDGTLEVDWRGGTEIKVYTEGGLETVDCAEEETGEASAHFVRQMEEFLAALSEKREPYTSGREERGTLAAILAGYESIGTGKPVTLST